MMSYSVSSEKKKSLVSEQKFEEMLDIYSQQGSQAFTQFVNENNLPHIWKIVAAKLELKVPIPHIKKILDYKIRNIVSKLDQDIITLRQMSALAPAVGMFGSVLGLIRLLANMKDFASLGSNMSLALITTLYGIFLGNIIFVPIARHIEKRKFMSIKNHENVTYWLTAVEENKPSFYLKHRLREITSDVKES